MLTITATNFSKDNEWLFKLEDGEKSECYIMQTDFYIRNNLVSPVNKSHLDRFENGTVVQANIVTLDGRKVVTQILQVF